MKAFKRQRKQQRSKITGISTRLGGNIQELGSWVYSKGKLRILSLAILFLSTSLIFSIAYDNQLQSPEASVIKNQNNVYYKDSGIKTLDVVKAESPTGLPTAGVVNEILLNADITPNDIDTVSSNSTSVETTLVSEEEEIVEPTVDDYDYDNVGYTTTRLKIRKKPSTESKELEVLPFNEKVKYSVLEDNKDWYVINYNDKLAYISANYISDTKLDYQSYGVDGDCRKSYMDHSSITCVDSPQYKLKQLAYTSDNGVRAVNGRYLIAVGSYYTRNVGQYVDVILENGTVLECIVGDCKKDCDTKNGCRLGADGGAVEFIVQTSALNKKTRNMGDVSYTSDSWNSKVVEIRVYEKDIL